MFIQAITASTIAFFAFTAPASASAPPVPSQQTVGIADVNRVSLQRDRAPRGPLHVSLPRDGAVVGSPTIDVKGRLRGPLNQSAAQVTVNGQPAQIAPSSGGATFSSSNLELTVGQNSIVVVASAPGAPTQRLDLSVRFDPLTANNVAIEGRFAYAARGPLGLGVMNLRTRSYVTLPPPAGSNRVDDVAVTDGLLFLLDAANGGRLSVMDLGAPGAPTLTAAPVNVPVGPFAGVSAGGGRVVVSGGTGLMTVFSYGPNGSLGSARATVDLGIGQPDVLVTTNGERAFVSTDFAGSVNGSGFGLTTVALAAPPLAPSILSRTGLPGSGFTSGFQAPANFPIESALFGGEVLVAHGGGLSRVSASGVLLGTASVGFNGVGVDVAGGRAFVVGTGQSLAEFDLGVPGAPTLVDQTQVATSGAFTGVSVNERFVAIAGNQAGLIVRSR